MEDRGLRIGDWFGACGLNAILDPQSSILNLRGAREQLLHLFNQWADDRVPGFSLAGPILAQMCGEQIIGIEPRQGFRAARAVRDMLFPLLRLCAFELPKQDLFQDGLLGTARPCHLRDPSLMNKYPAATARSTPPMIRNVRSMVA